MRRGKYLGGHLGQFLEDYVDELLGPQETRRAAQHLVSCEACRRDVSAERDVMRRMRAVRLDPSRQASLVAGLLAFPSDDAADAPRSRPETVDRDAVPVLTPDAPAHYNRRRRAPVMGVAVIAVVCGGIAVTANVSPQRTAPGEPGTAHLTSSRHVWSDTLTDPHVAAAVPASAFVWGRSAEPLLAKPRASGTIAP